MNQRPIHIWLLIVLLAAITVWLLYAVAAGAAYFLKEGHSLRLMAAYVPALIGAAVCAMACAGLFLRKAWTRWLFLLPVVVTAFQLVALAPYLLLALRPISDPAAKASIGYVLSGAGQPLLFFVVAAAVAIAVFRYFRSQRSQSQ